MKTHTLAWVAATLALQFGAADLAAQGFQVVVSAGNAHSQITAQELSDIFLKRTHAWPDGSSIDPVDLAEGASARAMFSRAVHGRTTSDVKTHWQRQIFSGRGVPPKELGDDQAVLEFVRSNPNGIGYVSAEVTVGPGLKVLPVVR